MTAKQMERRLLDLSAAHGAAVIDSHRETIAAEYRALHAEWLRAKS